MPRPLSDLSPLVHVDTEASPENLVQCRKVLYRRLQEASYDMHYALEFGIVLSGAMQRLYRDWDTVLERGEVWFCRMWEPHGYRIAAAPCRAMVCVVWPPFLARMRFPDAPGINWLTPFLPAPCHRPRVSPTRRARFAALGERLLATRAERETSLQRSWVQLLLLEAFLELMRSGRHRPIRGASEDTFERVNRAIEIVFGRRTRVGVTEAARACGMSRNGFGRLFYSVTGISFSQFGLRYRLSAAANDLAAGSLPIKALAGEWGFTDEAHLHRLFMRYYGLSPYQYRRQRQSGLGPPGVTG
ncbi:MAG: AraC family transcriptional regulator [Planctomycetota bacterium]